MLKYARENGKDIKVICTETRPYLQGARLTAWSVSELGMDTRLITEQYGRLVHVTGDDSKGLYGSGPDCMDGTVANRWGHCNWPSAPVITGFPFYISRVMAVALTVVP